MRLSAQHGHGVVYYRCGSYELPIGERCALATHAIRETELLPWVDKIMDGFEEGKISGKWLLKSGEKLDKETATEAIAKIGRKIKRTGDRSKTRNSPVTSTAPSLPGSVGSATLTPR